MDQNLVYDLEPAACGSHAGPHSGAMTALRLLHTYNHFVVPPVQFAVLTRRWKMAMLDTPCFREHAKVSGPSPVCGDGRGMVPLLASLPPPCLPSYCQHLPLCSPLSASGIPSIAACEAEARRRGEKRPIPAEMKDEKYFERRRRNNQAAKKSRDARRMREDQIAWRACLLEQENASLRAHINALRQETLALRALLAARDEASAPTSTTAD